MLRIAYVVEFLIALIAFFASWSQIGGQNHLDMMAWYWKCSLAFGVALGCVRATAAAVEAERAWNLRTLRWLVAVIALLAASGAVTYYYHMNEPADEQEEQVTATARRSGVEPASL